DLAVRPRLHAGPLDAVVEIPGLARRPVLHVAGRAAAAARIDPHADVALGHPFLRIADLPALVLIARTGHHVGLLLFHALPGSLVAVLEVQPLAIRAVAQENRVTSLLHRPEDVATKHQPVVHGDRHVPVDLHAVADFADLAITHDVLLLKIFTASGDDVSSRSCLGNDGEENEGRAVGPGVQRHVAAVHFGRPVARIVVHERTHAGPHLAERFDSCAGLAWKDIVGPTHRQRDSVALRQGDAGRPDLDVDLVDLAGRKLLLLVVCVIGAVG